MLKYAFDPVSYSAQYPLAPLGGVFVAVVGVSILLGSLFPSARTRLVWVGFPLATIALLASRGLAAGEQAPPQFNWGLWLCPSYSR